MSDEAKFVIAKPGEKPDPKNYQDLLPVCKELLKRWDKEQDLQLYQFKPDGSSAVMSYSQRNFLRCSYAVTVLQASPEKIQVRDAAGNVRPLVDPAILAQGDDTKSMEAVTQALTDLKTSKDSGLYSADDDFWLLPPAAENPEFEQNVQEFQQLLPNIWTVREQAAAMMDEKAREVLTQKSAEPYPTEVSDEDENMFPGLNGNKVLEGTLNFLSNCPPFARVLIGGLAGVIAYKTMGIKGVIGLVMLSMMLKRVLKMGAQAIEDQRVDMVTRAISDGIPVDKNGRIDSRFLEAVYKFPIGDHDLRSREVSTKLVKEMEWQSNKIEIDPNIKLVSSEDRVAQLMDGDTLQGDSGIRYRLAGIDATELKHEGIHQPGAQLAWDRVRELVPPGSKIRVETISNQPTMEGRQPVYLYFQNAEGEEACLNEVLLREGLCRPTNLYPYHPKIETYIMDFMEAAHNRFGLWNQKFSPVKPPSIVSVSKTVEPTPAGGEKTSFAIN